MQTERKRERERREKEREGQLQRKRESIPLIVNNTVVSFRSMKNL